MNLWNSLPERSEEIKFVYIFKNVMSIPSPKGIKLVMGREQWYDIKTMEMVKYLEWTE